MSEDKNVQKIIGLTAESTARAVVGELKRQGLMKSDLKNPFQKTEQLLYNYNSFKAAIRDKEEQIRVIEEIGLAKKSKSVTSYCGDDGYVTCTTDTEKAEDKISALESSIIVTKKFIAIVDGALSKISADEYYDIIRRKYFEGQSMQDIAEDLEVDVSTICRRKNKLINQLKITLFSDEVIYELFS